MPGPSQTKGYRYCPRIIASCGVLLILLGGCSDMPDEWLAPPYAPRSAYTPRYAAPRPSYYEPLYTPSTTARQTYNPPAPDEPPPQPPTRTGWFTTSANAAPVQPQPRRPISAPDPPPLVKPDPSCGWWDLAHLWKCPQ